MSAFATDLSKRIESAIGKRSKARDTAAEIVKKAQAESRDFTKEEGDAINAAQGEMEARTKEVDQLQKTLRIEEDLARPGEARSRTLEGEAPQAGEPEARGNAKPESQFASPEYREAFGRWMRGGAEALGESERRALSPGNAAGLISPELRALTTVTTGGGYTIPTAFVSQIDTAAKSFSGCIQAPTFKLDTDSGNPLPWPTVDDTSTAAEQLAENTAAASADPTFGVVNLSAYTISSKTVLVPIQLMQDTGVDMESLLAKLLGERLGRFAEQRYTTGTGSSQAQGIITGAAAGVTAAGATAIAYNDLVNLEHSVDPGYRSAPSCGWMFHDSIHAVVKKIVDGSGRPIFLPNTSGVSGSFPATIMGRPFYINMQMQATVATATKTVLFGDFEKFAIRRVRGIQLIRMAERYAEALQVGFLAFIRSDSRILNSAALKVLTQA
jgi:HK97 family phage major capsid protein